MDYILINLSQKKIELRKLKYLGHIKNNQWYELLLRVLQRKERHERKKNIVAKKIAFMVATHQRWDFSEL